MRSVESPDAVVDALRTQVDALAAELRRLRAEKRLTTTPEPSTTVDLEQGPCADCGGYWRLVSDADSNGPICRNKHYWPGSEASALRARLASAERALEAKDDVVRAAREVMACRGQTNATARGHDMLRQILARFSEARTG